MLAAIGTFFARSALMTSPLGGPLKALLGGLGRLLGLKVSLRVWMLVAALAFAWHWHHGKVKAADRAGYSRAMGEVEGKAIALKTKIDTLTTKISTELRSRNDEENRRIARDAGALRLRGPGKAACPAGARLPSGSGGYISPGGLGDAAGSQVPDRDRAAVPWGWLVDRAEEHDADRAEVVTWREWYRKMVAAWPKAGRPQPAPAASHGNP